MGVQLVRSVDIDHTHSTSTSVLLDAVLVIEYGGNRIASRRRGNRQDYRSWLVQVGDGDGYVNGGVDDGGLLVASGIVPAVADGYRDVIGALGLVVQGVLGLDLPGGGVDVEGCCVGSGESVGEGVRVVTFGGVVGVCGWDRISNILTRCGIFCDLKGGWRTIKLRRVFPDELLGGVLVHR